MTEVRMNVRQPQQNQLVRIFVTWGRNCDGYDQAMLADYDAFVVQKLIDLKVYFESNIERYQVVSFWEEFGQNGYHHIHGLIHLKADKKRPAQWLQFVQQELGLDHPCVEQCKNSNAQIFNYKNKPGKAELWQRFSPDREQQFFRVGSSPDPRTHSSAGRRTDIINALQSCRTYNQLVIEHPDVAAKGSRVFQSYYALQNKVSRLDEVFNTQVFWFYGDAGLGKSTFTKKLSNKLALETGGSIYLQSNSNYKWWTDYNDESIVIFEDVRRSNFRDCGGPDFLLKLLNRDRMLLEIKGGSCVKNWSYVIVNCPMDPVKFFTFRRDDGNDIVSENAGQLVRRCTKIIQFSSDVSLEHGNELVVTDRTDEFKSNSVGYLNNISRVRGSQFFDALFGTTDEHLPFIFE